VGKFVISAIGSLDGGPKTVDGQSSTVKSLADLWIEAQLNKLVRNVERQFQNFQYGQAGQEIYEFIWSDFADWYVEIAKEQMKKEESREQTVVMLAKVFDTSLRLLHPFTPFVTEEIWGHLHSALRESSLKDICKDWPQALIAAKFPEPTDEESWEAKSIADFELLQELVRSIRNLRAEKGVAPSKKLSATISAGDKLDLISNQISVIASLAGLDQSQVSSLKSLTDKPKDSAALVVGSIEIYLPLAGMVDLANEKARLEKELKEAESHITRLENLLNSDFANKAPAALVQKEKEKLAGYKDTADKIKSQLK
jgi:valyl-tRNA synthetase